MTEEMFEKLAQSVIDGEPEDAVALAKQALDQGLDPLECITNGLTKGIQKVGELFADGEYFLPELIIGADAMKGALDVLEPALMGDQKREVVAQVVLGTVEGDLHEIGKTLVGTMLTANGFQVKDIGVDQPASAFVEAAKEHSPQLVGLSALLTTTMPAMRDIVKALRDAKLDIKILTGGAPITAEYASEIGADGYAPDAGSAVDAAMALLQGKA